MNTIHPQQVPAIDSQKERILTHLQQGKSITPIEALSMFDCFRLGARIADLRKEGYDIKTTILNRGVKRFASYSLSN